MNNYQTDGILDTVKKYTGIGQPKSPGLAQTTLKRAAQPTVITIKKTTTPAKKTTAVTTTKRPTPPPVISTPGVVAKAEKFFDNVNDLSAWIEKYGLYIAGGLIALALLKNRR